MNRTVDLVVAGDGSDVVTAAARALRRERRVLAVLRSGDRRVVQAIRRRLRAVACAAGGRVTVMTNAAVVCVDGVDRVEAVVIRYRRTGRLRAVNASAFVRTG